MRKPKIGLYYDWLNQWGGAERVLVDLIKLFPEAPVFCLVYDRDKCQWLPKGTKVRTSFINRLPLSKNNPVWYTPFYGLAVEKLDMSEFDIVISTTSTVGHGLLTRTDSLFVCYMHNINRYLYNTPVQFKYFEPILRVYRKMDRIFGQRPDEIWCNSKTVLERIKKAYGREAKVISPGVDLDVFKKTAEKSDYYLVVSRLVKHKRLEAAMEGCYLAKRKLVILGTGRDEKYYKSMNKGNVEFINRVTTEKLVKLYSQAKGLICPQIEDFGLAPLEAMACGTGVLTLNQGGVAETVVSGKTGVHFGEQSGESVFRAIRKYEELEIGEKTYRDRAGEFSRYKFVLHFKQEIDKLWLKHQKIIST